MREISWVAEDILASQEGLCSMELVYTFLISVKTRSLQRLQILAYIPVISVEWKVYAATSRE
jgi:hypothetical protein